MKIATNIRPYLEQKLLVIHSGENHLENHSFNDLTTLLNPGDVFVINDAATIPASILGKSKTGANLEIRLVAHNHDDTWTAVLFGEGDWHLKTENRLLPPKLGLGHRIFFTGGYAEIVRIRPESFRMVELRFSEKNFWQTLYTNGLPIQYSYLRENLANWAIQTPFANEPWAMEMPSASRVIRWEQILALRNKGVEICSLTHAAGISSTGDEHLDKHLPFPERYKIPKLTAEIINHRRGRLIASGTSVVRALESSIDTHGQVTAGESFTSLIIDKNYHLKTVDGLLTGIHDIDESHYRLIEAFLTDDLARKARHFAEFYGYLGHEFGDHSLILP